MNVTCEAIRFIFNLPQLFEDLKTVVGKALRISIMLGSPGRVGGIKNSLNNGINLFTESFYGH